MRHLKVLVVVARDDNLLFRVFRVQCLCNRHKVSRIESGNRGKAQDLR
jgi:hypothetical protein